MWITCSIINIESSRSRLHEKLICVSGTKLSMMTEGYRGNQICWWGLAGMSDLSSNGARLQQNGKSLEPFQISSLFILAHINKKKIPWFFPFGANLALLEAKSDTPDDKWLAADVTVNFCRLQTQTRTELLISIVYFIHLHKYQNLHTHVLFQCFSMIPSNEKGCTWWGM